MKKILYRLTAVITAIALFITVQAAYEARIPKMVVHAAALTTQPTEASQSSAESTESTEGAEEMESVEVTVNTEETESVEVTVNTEETESGESTESTEETDSGESTESTEETESVEVTVNTEETESVEVTVNTEETESVEVTVNTEETESSESGENTEETESSESVESTEETESGESTESTEETESGEPVESTEETESSESVESTEATESSEPVESTEETENSESVESTEETENSESVESTEETGSSESAESTEVVENTESTESTESGNSTEATESESVEESTEQPSASSSEEDAWSEVVNQDVEKTPPSYDYLYSVVETYKPEQPKDTIEKGLQDEFRTALEDTKSGLLEAASDEIQDKVFEAVQDTAKTLSKNYYQQAYDLYDKAGDLLQKTYNDRNSYKYFLDNDFMEATHQKYGAALELMDDAAVSSFKGDVTHLVDTGIEIYGKIGDTISVVGDAVTIGQDLAALGDLKNEHSSWRAVEATLLVTDIGLAAVSIGATIGLVTLGPAATIALAIGSVVVGVSSSFIHSDAFADYMNSTDGSLQSFLEGLFPWMKTPDGVNCYKPNIYIYDKEGRRIQVIFTQPQLIVESIPEYEAGWAVDASADGTLLTDAGEEYDFLFYESQTVRGMFDTQKGFYIDDSEREIQWTNILSEYGFNEEEIADFIEFWDVKLDVDKDYIMYPQYTEKVDEAMPIIVAPYPDNMVRIWFVFEEYKGQKYQEEEIKAFSRDGYTVVEWGGMIF